MSKTCIVCGGPAGSGEHVFPASLGGRRVNRGIYCATHDNGYSSLVGELASQLDVFNAMLGVRPDHSDDVKSVQTQDRHSGQMIELSAKSSKFTEPRVISRKQHGNGVVLNMGFPDRQSIKAWIADQKTQGIDVVIQEKGAEQTYFLDTVHFSRVFGGAYGLAAVGYVAQTFLAQAFPELARSGDVEKFKRFTQIMAVEAQKKEDKPSAWTGDSPVWWDFDQQPETTPNAFDFGHRVTVGVDADDGLIYGRISFFSSLHFSMVFGVSNSTMPTKSVTVDIDPLAEHPPNDKRTIESATANVRVSRPASQTSGLTSAIANSTQEGVFNELLKRMTDHSLARTAKEMHAELFGVSGLQPNEIEARLLDMLEKRSQRIWNLARWFVQNFKESPHGRALPQIWSKLDALVELDQTSSNGLSSMATTSFELAKQALLSEMFQDFSNGRLDERRLAELMGEGPGAAIVGRAILEPLVNSFPE